jgi:hypothetical protein
MTEAGVFAVHRGIWGHPRFKREPFTEREAFLWLISEAAYKPRRLRIGSTVVELERGQLAHSLRFMAAKWGWKETRVRRFLARLKTDASIDAATDAGQTVITICNYDSYQFATAGSDAPSDAADDARATQQRRKEEERNKEIKEDGAPEAPEAKRTRSLAKPAYTLDFVTFFNGYKPHCTVANPKAKAFDVWKRLGPDDQQAALASLPILAADCEAKRRKRPDHTAPGAAVYLFQRRFDDFQPSAAAQAADPAKIRTGQLIKAREHCAGRWQPTWGPRPGEPGCTIPADVLAEASGAAAR